MRSTIIFPLLEFGDSKQVAGNKREWEDCIDQWWV